jgi:transposase/transposase InsO family protein
VFLPPGAVLWYVFSILDYQKGWRTMEKTDWRSQREAAIHLLRSGRTVGEVAQQLKRPECWVYKWKKRFDEEGWAGLADRSRAPHHVANKLPEKTRQAIRQARSELEAEAERGDGLHYIGSHAVLARLREKKLTPLPGTASIERVLSAAEMTRPHRQRADKKVHYPRLHPTKPHQQCQVDIVPHFLLGGQSIACFNGIDVVSRYPAGQQSLRKRSQDASESLIHIWQQLGIACYTQIDNEACFSGGFTHPGVLGKVLRLALSVGTELVFSPVRHPESNAYVERFHQDYNQHVWQDTQLEDLEDVQKHSQAFYHRYRRSHHHSALRGRCPAQVHTQHPRHKLLTGFQLPQDKQPLTEGRVHFIRKVSAQQTVSILNLHWDVPKAKTNQGVWATLEITLQGATLRIYDAAPDATHRTCLAEHPFPLKEKVFPLRPRFRRRPTHRSVGDWIAHMPWGLAANLKRHLPFYDVLMARLSVKAPRFSTMS